MKYTQTTLDKLESIKGFKCEFSNEDFHKIVTKHGTAIVGLSGDLCPADKKMYSLRDVSGTVESIELTAASIMCGKLAAGTDALVIDCKTGTGSFFPDKEEALLVARKMFLIAKKMNK